MKSAHEEIQMFILIKLYYNSESYQHKEVIFTISRLEANNVITMHEHEQQELAEKT